MAKTYPVKWITNTMRGAPRLSGTAGDLINVLDALLITGWGAITPISITVASGIATVVTNVDESFEQDAVVLVSGAAQGALNGQTRVLTSTSTGITFATSAADGTASGTISIKYAPQGSWEKVFSGTNKAVYRSTDPAGPRFYYRVDDTGTTTAQVRGYEAMTDVDTGTLPFPTPAQMPNSCWHKSFAADTSVRRYFIAADDRAVLFGAEPYSPNYPGTALRGFGDMLALVPTDSWCATVSASYAATANTNGAAAGSFSSPDYSLACTYLARAATGASTPVPAQRVPYVGRYANYSGNDDILGRYPPIDNKLPLSKIFLAADRAPRCDVPGVYHVAQSGVAAAFAEHQHVAVGDRKFILLPQTSGIQYAISNTYRTAVDLIGPWRQE